MKKEGVNTEGVNRDACLRFVLGNDVVIVEGRKQQKETASPKPEPAPARVRIDPFFVGGITSDEGETLSDKNFAPVPPKVRPRTQEEMRYDLEVLEARTLGIPIPTPEIPLDATPRTAILWWLERHGMSAATCRRLYVPQMLLNLREKKVIVPADEANRILWEFEEEERRASQTIMARRR